MVLVGGDNSGGNPLNGRGNTKDFWQPPEGNNGMVITRKQQWHGVDSP